MKALPTGISRRGVGYFARVKANGKEASKTLPTLEEAISWRDAELRRRRRENLITELPTLRRAAQEQLARMKSGVLRNRHGDPYAATMITRYEAWLNRVWLKELGAHTVDTIRRRDVEAVLNNLTAKGMAGSTVRDALKPLQVIYRELVHDEVVVANPAVGCRLPRKNSRKARIDDPTDPMVVVGVKEAIERIGLLPPRERMIWSLAFFAGLRMGEIRGLEWGDVDLEGNGRIAVVRQIVTNEHERKLPKGGKTRVVPILKELRAELTLWGLEQGRSKGLVTGQTATRPWTYGHVIDHTRDAWEKADPPRRWITPHEARHTFVSMLAAAGVPSDDARAWSGHTAEEVRALYTHVMPNAYADAIRKVEAYVRRHR